MTQRPDTLARRLIPVARLRREQAPVRAVVALVSAGAFAVWLNRPVLWLWLAAYVAAQALEVRALSAFLRDDPARPPSRLRTAGALAAVAVLAAAFGSLSVLLTCAPSRLGGAAAALLLCAGVLNVLATSRGSGEAFAAGAAPYALLAVWLGVRLVASEGGADPLAPLMPLATLIFITTACLIWRDGERTRRRERAALEELERRRERTEAAWEARQAFVAAVGHELRTPLGAILAASGSLGVMTLEPENRAKAALIAEASRRMRRLLDDLLDLARLEAGRMTVELAPFDPRALVRDCAALWTAPAQGKGLQLVLEGEEGLPERATGDALRMRQVLDNLLSNAVKFTAEGEVRVRCEADDGSGDGLRLTLAVSDTGPGLEDEALARVFEPFTQAGPEIARLHGGSGLGLAISRELARLMGGSLSARRGPGGRGAVFSFALRLEPAAVAAAAPERAGEGGLELLVVDDHPMGRQALRLMLEACGAVVAEAATGPEALRVLEARPFDLVLMDVHLGGMDGREATRRLRAGDGPNAGTPVLGVTGLCGEAEARACAEAGMDGHLEKPVMADALCAAVARLTAGGEAARLAA